MYYDSLSTLRDGGASVLANIAGVVTTIDPVRKVFAISHLVK